MKKSKLFYALLVSTLFVGFLQSCVSSDQVGSSSDGAKKTSEATPTIIYNFDDNELSQKAFNELKKSFSSSTYNDFLSKGTKTSTNEEITFQYLSSTIVLNLDGSYKSKKIVKDNSEDDYLFINNEFVKIDSYITYNGEKKPTYHISFNKYGSFDYLEETEYDNNGKLLTTTKYDFERNTWVLDFKTDNKYDSNDILLGNIMYDYKNDTWVYDSKLEYTYDDNGNKSTETYYEYENDTWVYDFKLEYTYDDNGDLLTETNSNYENDTWVYASKSEYTYDDNGNKSTETYYEYVNGGWEKEYTNEYITINGEQRYKCMLTFKPNGEVNNKNEYTYDIDASHSTIICYGYENDGWWKAWEDECVFLYDDYYPTKSIIFKSDGSYYEKVICERNNYGDILTETRFLYENGEWVYTAKFENTYDAIGNTLTNKYYDYLNDTWVITVENEYVYVDEVLQASYVITLDESGEIESKIESTYDDNGYISTEICYKYENDNWVCSTKKEYTNDDKGRILTETQFSYEDDAWVKNYTKGFVHIHNTPLNNVLIYYNHDGSYYQKSEYTFDENYDVLTETQFLYENDTWVYNSKIEYTRRSDGKATAEIKYKYENDAWVYDSKIECTYDDNDNLLTIIEYIYENGAWVIM